MNFGTQIKIRRKMLGITQAELAQKVGYTSPSSIAKIETGEIDLSISKIEAIASALNIDLSSLFVPDSPIASTKASSANSTYSDTAPREIKDRIKTRRLELGLSAEKVAEMVGVSKSTVIRWENGDISSLRSDIIANLAYTLQVSPDYLILSDINTNYLSAFSAKQIGERIRERRLELGISQEHLATELGYTSRSSIAKIESGINALTFPKIQEFAKVLQVSPAQLVGWENMQKAEKNRIPVLCGVSHKRPIFSNKLFLSCEKKTDFCFIFFGDSMIGARIHDGDIVFCRSQNMVENGEIAAVIIGDEATLKRVYYYPDKQKLVLQAENPKYEPFVYVGNELDEINIIGKAVAFQSDVI